MNGKWTTVSSYTELVEDPNPAVWYEAAKNADTYEEAMQLYDKAEKYYATDSMGYSPECFFKERLYYKFHKSRVIARGCIILIVLGSLLYLGYDVTKKLEMAKLEAERERYAVYQKEREQQQIREREIQKRIREQREKARMQAEKEAAEKEARKNAAKPEQKFLAFHQAITDRRLREAYNILSPDYQRFVGSYEKFAPGYDTTVSSEIVNLERLSENDSVATFSYRLKAVDRDRSGRKVQYFAGKVRLVKINDEWRIDSTEAKLESKAAPVKVAEKPKYGSSSDMPRQTFLKFHQSITAKRLRDAYNILSPDYQRFVGGYDRFIPGYNTTISSEIVELQTLSESISSVVYAYKLKAVDREGNGTKTQYFAGKAKLVRINGAWRLDSTEAKRL